MKWLKNQLDKLSRENWRILLTIMMLVTILIWLIAWLEYIGLIDAILTLLKG